LDVLSRMDALNEIAKKKLEKLEDGLKDLNACPYLT
jgi:hypothetical protein